jgi:hypothetical protein
MPRIVGYWARFLKAAKGRSILPEWIWWAVNVRQSTEARRSKTRGNLQQIVPREQHPDVDGGASSRSIPAEWTYSSRTTKSPVSTVVPGLTNTWAIFASRSA